MTTDFFELDFLPVGDTTSGDAICLRYQKNGIERVHVVDGGYADYGQKVLDHIDQYYGKGRQIDAVVATNPDQDHASGLRTVLREREVSELWMLRPWEYADELIDRFKHYSNVENLKRELRKKYPYIAELEAIALEEGIPIREPFQGTKIGDFIVLTPTKSRYLDLVVSSDKTPVEKSKASKLLELINTAAESISALWGDEKFSAQNTANENEMSVVQYVELSEKKMLLTADTGRDGLTEAADYVEGCGILQNLNYFQVPHHGSRRNVSTETLDRWLGERFDSPADTSNFTEMISAAENDKDHPRKAVIRAVHHRGGRPVATQGKTVCFSNNALERARWYPVTPLDYPEQQED